MTNEFLIHIFFVVDYIFVLLDASLCLKTYCPNEVESAYLQFVWIIDESESLFLRNNSADDIIDQGAVL